MPERCPGGHRLIRLSASVYACLPEGTSSVDKVWEWTGVMLASPPSYASVLALGQRLVDEVEHAAKIVHYGANGYSECGEERAEVTLDEAAVTCGTCRGWLPIVARRRPAHA
jgi:hypothetical protein